MNPNGNLESKVPASYLHRYFVWKLPQISEEEEEPICRIRFVRFLFQKFPKKNLTERSVEADIEKPWAKLFVVDERDRKEEKRMNAIGKSLGLQ